MPFMPKPSNIVNRWSSLLVLSVTLVLVGSGPSVGSPPPNNCAAGLGLSPIGMGEPLQGDLDVLSWNIQKASNVGWAEDLAEIAGGVQLAFIQEASLQAQIPRPLPHHWYRPLLPAIPTATRKPG